MQFDLRELGAGTELVVSGLEAGCASGTVNELRLQPGAHTIGWRDRPAAIGEFIVDRSGRVDYSPLLEGAFGGAQTGTLAVHAYPIAIDASAFSERQLRLPGVVDEFSSKSPQSLLLPPGRYTLRGAEGGLVGDFTVTMTGALDYDSALDGTFLGQGTTTLTLHAFHIVLDGHKLPAQSLAVIGVGFSFASNTPQTLDLAPGSYSLTASSRGAAGSFRVDRDGNVSFDDALKGAFSHPHPQALSLDALPATVTIQSQLNQDILLYSLGQMITAGTAQQYTLAPGDYAIMVYSAMFAHSQFTIADDGTVTYDPAYEGVLQGSGTNTLTIAGRPVTFDAHLLTQTAILPLWFNAQELDTRVVKTLNLMPADGYSFIIGSSMFAAATWNLAVDGTLTLGPNAGTAAAIAGTTLQLLGEQVTITATSVNDSTLLISLLGQGIELSSEQVNIVTLMPMPVGTGYSLLIGSSRIASLVFNVDGNGNFQFDSSFDGYVFGRGTTALDISPPLITIDATELGKGAFQLESLLGGGTAFDRSQPQGMRLLPAPKYSYTDGTTQFTFAVSDTGSVDYDSSYDNILRGRGGSTLQVLPLLWTPPPPPTDHPSAPADLLGRWPLNEGSGDVAHDASGNAHDGTLALGTPPNWSTDGPSLTFAPPSFVHIPGASTLQPTSTVSVELWLEEVSSSTPASAFTLGSVDGSQFAVSLQASQSSAAFLVILDGKVVSSPQLDRSVWDHRWHHFAGSYDGTSVRLFVDGIEVGHGNAASGSISYAGSGGDVFIGGAQSGGSFSGSINDVQLYGYALTPAQIANDSNGRLNAGPVALGVPSNTIVPPSLSDTTVQAPMGAGTPTVSDFGSANYHIPMWVPPGRNGMQPELSIDYNSYNDNGLLGVGWQLSGLSRISHCPGYVDIHDDSSHVGVHFDAQDTLCLGKERMIGVDFSGPNPHSRYQLFHDDHSTIIAHDFDPMGPTWFEVRTTDGRILTFGRDASARIEGDQTTTTPIANSIENTTTTTRVRFGWLLSRVEDRVGNYMTISYHDGTDPAYRGLPIEIDYTGSRLDPTTHRSVRFVYENRDPRDTQQNIWVGGFSLPRVVRLARVEMWGPDPAQPALLRMFSFAYQQSTMNNRTLLQSMTECDRPLGICRSEQFDYTQNDGSFTEVDPGIDDYTPNSFQVADIDGDGRDDVVYASDEFADDNNAHHLKFRLGNGSGFGAATQIAAEEVVGPAGTFSGSYGPAIADFDGDGHSDLFGRYPPASIDDEDNSMVYLSRLTGDTGNAAHGWAFNEDGPRHDKQGPNDSFEMYVNAADMDGDRFPEQISNDPGSFSGSPSRLFVWKNGNLALNGIGAVNYFATAALPITSDAYTTALDNLYVDIDGDGKSVLLSRNLNQTLDASGKPTAGPYDNRLQAVSPYGGRNTTLPALPYTTPTAKNHSYVFADFNGDGLNDSLITYYSPDKFLLYPGLALNTGAGYQVALAVANGPRGQRRVMDYDLDGHADVLARPLGTDALPSTTNLQAWTYHGDRMTARDIPIVSGLNTKGAGQKGDDYGEYDMVVLDVNGDGLDDLLIRSNDGVDGGTMKLHLYIRNGFKPDLLIATNGNMGRQTFFNYAPIQATTAGTTTPAQVPLLPVNGKVWVVASSSVDSGLGGMTVFQHTFQDGFTDIWGGGFQGFQKHIAYEPQTKTTTTRTFAPMPDLVAAPSYRTYFGAGIPVSEVVDAFFQSGTQTIERTTVRAFAYTHVNTIASPGYPYRTPSFVYPSLVTELVQDNATSGIRIVSDTVKTQTQNAYGDVTDQSTTWKIEGVVDTVHVDYTTTTTSDDPTPQWERPLLRTETNSVYNGPQAVRRTGWEYDSNGQLTKELVEPGAYGNGSWAALGPQGDGVQTLFTEYHRDADGLPILVVKSSSADGNTDRRATQTEYDGAERMFPALFRDPLGHVVQTAYHPGLGVLAQQVDQNGLTTSYQYDRFGRVRAQHNPAGDDLQVSYTNQTGTVDRGGLQASSVYGAILEQRVGGATTLTTVDTMGREVRRKTDYRSDNKAVYVDSLYDLLGHRTSVTRPYFSGSPHGATVSKYDNVGHLVSVQYPDGSLMTRDYFGNIAHTVEPSGRQTTSTTDTLGRVIRVAQLSPTDADASHQVVINYTYGPFDTLTQINEGGATYSNVYDRLGRRTIVSDPDAGGAQQLFYDVFGEVTDVIRGGTYDGTQVTGGDHSKTFYDLAGRVVERDLPGKTILSHWDAPQGIGALSYVQASDGPTMTYGYDPLARLSSKRWDVGGVNGGSLPAGGNSTGAAAGGTESFTIGYTYDDYNRPDTLIYPTVFNHAPVNVQNVYSPGGRLESVVDATSKKPYWSLKDSDASEQFPDEVSGNGVESVWSEDPSAFGRLASINSQFQGNPIQTLTYHWLTHNRLQERDDGISGAKETFDYDAVDRLKRWHWTGSNGTQRVVRYDLDDLGNLLAKAVEIGIGNSETFAFGTLGPHQPSGNSHGSFGYDSHGNQTNTPDRSIQFDAFDLPATLSTPSANYQFEYDGDRNRVARFITSNGRGEVELSLGGIYEEHRNGNNTDYSLLVNAGGRTVAQINCSAANGKLNADQLFYLHSAYGESVDAITDAAGNVTPTKYEPFGARVAANNSSQLVTASPDGVRTGFGGHEHDDDLGLINMVGRIYDPVQQRFLSRDPLMGFFDPQGLNPYAYGRNDPLNRIDPSGFADADASYQPTPSPVPSGNPNENVNMCLAPSETASTSQMSIGVGDGTSVLTSDGTATSISLSTSDLPTGSDSRNRDARDLKSYLKATGQSLDDFEFKYHDVSAWKWGAAAGAGALAALVGGAAVGVAELELSPAMAATLGRAMSWLVPGAAVVEKIAEEGPEVLRHYTDSAGYEGIMSGGGIIKANVSGLVFVTRDAVSPTDALNTLFAGNPAYEGKGSHIIEFVTRPGVELIPGTQPNEMIHYGSLRDGRTIDITFAGTNPH